MMWLAFNVVSDLIAGVICGLGIGYGLDRWLGTRPVFIAVFLILGCIAGVLNVVRFLQRYDKRHSEDRQTPQGKE
ncbi:MAG: AtpZ/AtpI family protein [Alphaproteobacteria bacterium]|nr:AtpZ/AtpI family protein [Alphaproteobacteria bacterium]